MKNERIVTQSSLSAIVGKTNRNQFEGKRLAIRRRDVPLQVIFKGENRLEIQTLLKTWTTKKGQTTMDFWVM